jgi:hypothetical protein
MDEKLDAECIAMIRKAEQLRRELSGHLKLLDNVKPMRVNSGV